MDKTRWWVGDSVTIVSIHIYMLYEASAWRLWKGVEEGAVYPIVSMRLRVCLVRKA